jgi:hypothetical protein
VSSDPLPADQRAGRPQGDQHERREPPSPQPLHGAARDEVHEQQEAAAVDRAEHIDDALGLRQRSGDQHDEQEAVDHRDLANEVEQLAGGRAMRSWARVAVASRTARAS